MRATIAYVLAVVAMLGLLALFGLLTLNRMMSAASERARAERDAYWTAEIERSNAETEKRLRLQAMAAQAADSAARDTIAAANLKIVELEKANDALPDNRCGGLGRDRVQLLDLGRR